MGIWGVAYRVVDGRCADGVSEVDKELKGEDEGKEVSGHNRR